MKTTKRFFAVVTENGEIIYGATTYGKAYKLLSPEFKDHVVKTNKEIPIDSARKYQSWDSYKISDFQ